MEIFNDLLNNVMVVAIVIINMLALALFAYMKIVDKKYKK